MRTGSGPEEIAAGVYWITDGTGGSNVYLVRSGSSWVLIDAAWPHRGERIKRSAEKLFGADVAPASILLTHLHPDHAGSAAELVRAWHVSVYVDPGEMPLPTGQLAYSDPIGRVIGPFTRFLPAGEFEACLRIATPFDPSAGVPGLPDWDRIPTPGHIPGHVSYFRARDRVLITGDALLTVNARSLWGLLPGRTTISGPPRISTWRWSAAAQSIAVLARLEPQVLAPGHGPPMTTAATAAAVRSFAERLASKQRAAQGFLRPVDYSRRTRYRRPPGMYLRFQPLGTLLTAAGISPDYVITLEVPGRRSGVIRRTSLVRVTRDGNQYLVALAGESDWVRNACAADGRVVLGRRERYAARLAEVPENERAPVIQAYLLRAGRRVGSKAVTNEARYYFGLSADPSLAEIGRITRHYPVFRIIEDGRPPPTATRHPRSQRRSRP